MVKYYFQIFRAQTYPATMLCMIIPLLASSEFSLKAVIFILLALPLHYFTFGHNSVMDYYHDLGDKYKSHHPLISGTISLAKAHNVVQTGLIITASLFVVVSLFLAANPALALLFFSLYIIFGHGYNDGLGKSSKFSFIPISLCFASLGGFGWFITHSSLDYLGALIILYLYYNILYQIAWEGNLKDVESDKINLLKYLGAKVEGSSLNFNLKSLSFGWAIRVALFFTLLAITSYTWKLWGWIFFLLSILTSYKIMSRKIPWGRDRALLMMSLTEVFTIYALLFTVVEEIAAIILAAIGILYFFAINKILWEAPYPKV